MLFRCCFSHQMHKRFYPALYFSGKFRTLRRNIDFMYLDSIFIVKLKFFFGIWKSCIIEFFFLQRDHQLEAMIQEIIWQIKHATVSVAAKNGRVPILLWAPAILMRIHPSDQEKSTKHKIVCLFCFCQLFSIILYSFMLTVFEYD